MSEGYKLKKGDCVVMHTCMEHDHPSNFGRIWVCRSNEFKHKGHDYGSVMLEGFSGSFSTEFLQKVNVTDELFKAKILRPVEEWHEDDGYVLWWKTPIEEPPYCGTPLDSEWDDYYTHWTPLITPSEGEYPCKD